MPSNKYSRARTEALPDSDVEQQHQQQDQQQGHQHEAGRKLLAFDSPAGAARHSHAHQPWLEQSDAGLILIAGIVAILLCIGVTQIKVLVESQAGVDSWAQLQPSPGAANPAAPVPVPNAGSPSTGQPPPQQESQQRQQWQPPQAPARSKRPWPAGGLRRPLVIAHRGASGAYPEHTRAAYLAAVEMGADIIECDVVLTRDLVGICRHDVNLVGSTDVSDKFPERRTTYHIDGQDVTGIFAADLTLAEVQQLRAVQPWPFRDQQYNKRLPIVTLDEYLDIALSAPRTVGVYPETKNPTWHNGLPHVRAADSSIEQVVLAALTARGYQGPINSAQWLRQPAYIQSFEMSSLEVLSRNSSLPLIQLLEGNLSDKQPDGHTVQELLEGDGFKRLKGLVAGVGPGKTLLVQWQPSTAAAAGAGTGSVPEEKAGKKGGSDKADKQEKKGADVKGSRQKSESGSRNSTVEDNEETGRYVSSGVVEKLHAAGLQVHPYTLRNEPWFVLPLLRGNTTAELDLLVNVLGVDGAFTDYANSMVEFLEHQKQKRQASGARGSNSIPRSPVAGKRHKARPSPSNTSGGARARRGGRELSRHRQRGTHGLLRTWLH